MGCSPGPWCLGDTSGELEHCWGEPILRNFICLITVLIAPERNDGPGSQGSTSERTLSIEGGAVYRGVRSPQLFLTVIETADRRTLTLRALSPLSDYLRAARSFCNRSRLPVR